MEQTYFKLVRPDYKAFYDGNFKWPIKGIVEVRSASPNGPCGVGLHLARTVENACKYSKFPFRILSVKPLSPILGQDEDKIRVAKAESLGELPIPKWAKFMEKRVRELPGEMKSIPWFQGGDVAKAKQAVEAHLRLLVPFGLRKKIDIEVIDNWQDAEATWDAAWDAANDAAKYAAWGAVKYAAWDAAGYAAKNLLNRKNPFKPLMEAYKCGGLPIGFVGKVFKLFMKKR